MEKKVKSTHCQYQEWENTTTDATDIKKIIER